MLSRAAAAALAAPLAAAVLALAGSASADPGGAQVLHFRQCDPFGGDIVFCQQGQVVSNTTVTPSGNISVIGHLLSRLSFEGTNCATSNTLRQDFHELLKGGPDLVQRSFQRREKFTVDCPPIFGDLRQSCEIVAHFQIANGQVVFARQGDLTCTPLP
jgi:hypothetical protein